ncbi:hypothetical protein MKK88_13535 [Methylobacterium sp. E-005]|uniref:hypothetical protein n=1 Tax=Methylobacterium sp. E-005 TaxID=2836549 RepID=UPI001FBA9D97|nr:hypothetical protein [Methylobacterium sp. E-005]MCJ2087003.1 hypothetical protein [Methylobacterium sp. E-005]
MDRTFPTDGNAGLERPCGFPTDADADYAGFRKLDRGPEGRPTTSALSLDLRRLLVTETGVVTAADRAFGAGDVDTLLAVDHRGLA